MSSEDKQGGVESYLINQYRNFTANKIKCDFIKQGYKKMACQDEILNNGDFIYSICERRQNPIRCLWDVIKLMYSISGKYDVFIMNLGAIPTCGMMLFFAYMANIPMRVVHSHGSGIEYKRNFFKRCMDSL